MTFQKKDILKAAELAHIEMPEDKLAELAPSMSNILNWVEQLSELNTDGIEPLANVSNANAPLRADITNDGNIQNDILENAPDKREGFFAVQKIVE